MNIMPEPIEIFNRYTLGTVMSSAPMIIRHFYRGQIEWYKERGGGSTPNRNEAWVFRAQECYDRRLDDPGNAQYETLPPGTPIGYLSDPAPMGTPAVPKSLMEQKLVPTAIEMLKLAPKNPVARAYVQAAVREPVPEELDTYEAIGKWFEENYTPPATPTNPESVARRPAPRLAIEIPYTEGVSGSCDYTATVHGMITDNIDVDDLIQLIDDNNCEDMNDLVSAVVSSAASEGEHDFTSEDNYNYENHETADYNGVEPDPDRREIAERLRDFLSEHSPETLESLE